MFLELGSQPGPRLILDAEGLHLRRQLPETDFDGLWAEMYAVRVDRSYDPPRVVATFVHGAPETRSSVSSTEIHLPEIIGHPPESVVAEVETFKRSLSAMLRGFPPPRP